MSGSCRRIERSPRAKVRPFFSFTGNLRDPLELIFDRIFDGDDLVFVVLDLAQRRVEGGGFAGTGRARDEHHPVGLGDVAAEFHEIALAEADHVERELGELLAHRLFIEHAQHGVFAVDGGHDRDAEIDEPRFVADAETPVLRDAPLGDIELAHDLDAGNDGGVPVLRDGRHGVMQDAVNAVLDDDFLIARFDVDVARAPLERVEDRGVDQLDDRRDVAIDRSEPVDGKRFFGVVFVAHDVEREAFGDFFEDALRLLGFLEEVGNLGGGRHLDAEFLVQQQAEFVDRVEVARVGEGDFEGSVLRLEGHEVVTEHQVDGNGAEKVVLDGAVAEVDEFAAVAKGGGLGLGDLTSAVCGVEHGKGESGLRGGHGIHFALRGHFTRGS